jgi:protein gp37
VSNHTPIEWADSTVNPVMGCDGCELWMPEAKVPVKKCYAGQLHQVRAGRPGYADRFDEPKLFPGRMAAAARWSDLRGVHRPDKPWFNAGPRVILVSDMGDALSRGVPFDFLCREIIDAAGSEKGMRHLWFWLIGACRVHPCRCISP